MTGQGRVIPAGVDLHLIHVGPGAPPLQSQRGQPRAARVLWALQGGGRGGSGHLPGEAAPAGPLGWPRRHRKPEAGLVIRSSCWTFLGSKLLPVTLGATSLEKQVWGFISLAGSGYLGPLACGVARETWSCILQGLQAQLASLPPESPDSLGKGLWCFCLQDGQQCRRPRALPPDRSRCSRQFNPRCPQRLPCTVSCSTSLATVPASVGLAPVSPFCRWVN